MAALRLQPGLRLLERKSQTILHDHANKERDEQQIAERFNAFWRFQEQRVDKRRIFEELKRNSTFALLLALLEHIPGGEQRRIHHFRRQHKITEPLFLCRDLLARNAPHLDDEPVNRFYHGFFPFASMESKSNNKEMRDGMSIISV